MKLEILNKYRYLFGAVRLCPKGAAGLSPGFQPWETTPKRRAPKGRQIERPNHTKARRHSIFLICSLLSPLQGDPFDGWFPGLTPWAESLSPFGAGPLGRLTG